MSSPFIRLRQNSTWPQETCLTAKLLPWKPPHSCHFSFSKLELVCLFLPSPSCPISQGGLLVLIVFVTYVLNLYPFLYHTSSLHHTSTLNSSRLQPYNPSSSLNLSNILKLIPRFVSPDICHMYKFLGQSCVFLTSQMKFRFLSLKF